MVDQRHGESVINACVDDAEPVTLPGLQLDAVERSTALGVDSRLWELASAAGGWRSIVGRAYSIEKHIVRSRRCSGRRDEAVLNLIGSAIVPVCDREYSPFAV